MRKIISVVFDGRDNMHALCDDGALYMLSERGWKKFPPIPQEYDPEARAKAWRDDHPELHSEVEPAPPIDRWLPSHVIAIWTETKEGNILQVVSRNHLEACAELEWRFAEASNEAAARVLFNDNHPALRDWFKLNGRKYEYLTDSLPF